MAALYWTGILIGRFAASLYMGISAQRQLIYSSVLAVLLIILGELYVFYYGWKGYREVEK